MADQSDDGITVVSWTPLQKNTLRGFATVRLPCGLKIFDVSLHIAGEKAWASLPKRPVVGANGQAQREPTGKVRHLRVAEWKDRAAADRFSAEVIAATEAHYPGAVLR